MLKDRSTHHPLTLVDDVVHVLEVDLEGSVVQQGRQCGGRSQG